MPELSRSDQALTLCLSHSAHLQHDSPIGDSSQIESALVGYVISVLYSEAEDKIKEFTATRVTRGGNDPRVTSFGRVASDRLIRSIKIGELKGVLGYFGSECKNYFEDHLSEKQCSDWNSVIQARHQFAHHRDSPTPSLTLHDLENYYSSFGDVIDLFSESLLV